MLLRSVAIARQRICLYIYIFCCGKHFLTIESIGSESSHWSSREGKLAQRSIRSDMSHLQLCTCCERALTAHAANNCICCHLERGCDRSRLLRFVASARAHMLKLWRLNLCSESSHSCGSENSQLYISQRWVAYVVKEHLPSDHLHLSSLI